VTSESDVDINKDVGQGPTNSGTMVDRSEDAPRAEDVPRAEAATERKTRKLSSLTVEENAGQDLKRRRLAVQEEKRAIDS
jgi:hypothetical protein